MSARLRDLIKSVRASKTAAEERAIIQQESANIRTSIKEEIVDHRHRNIAKLLYMQMLGYPTHWGQMECLKLIASPYYTDKRIGYLGLMILLDETQELLTMVTNHMKNDLNHPNQFVAGLALCALGNISSQGIARDLAPEVEKLLGSTNPYLRKKAALCAIRVLRKCPDLMENFVPRIRSLLSDRNHGVLITGVTLMTELCESDPHNIDFFRRLVPTLVRILKNLVMSGYAPEYDVSGITDPFLQCRILKLLRILGKGDAESTDIMNDILAQVATNTDHTRNVGNAILYECVQTIMSVEAEDGLRLLGINVLGRFLQNRDNNIRYVALSTLSRVVGTDIEAVQRHRNTIVDCLKDPDVSIRKRALELIYALVNESNIKILAIELLNFLQNTTAEFRPDLAVNLCRVTERFSPNKRWQIDTILRVLSIAGSYVPEEVCNNLVTLIASHPDLQSYAVQKMYVALTNDIQSQQPLIQVAVWCIGEFGDLLVQPGSDKEIVVSEKDVVDLLDRILKLPSTTRDTRQFALTAVMKLTTRFSNDSVVVLKQIVDRYTSSIEAEIQQRAIEYTKLFAWDNIRRNVLDRIPVQDNTDSMNTPVATPVQQAQPAKEKNLLDWEEDLGLKPSAPAPTTGGAKPAPSSLDLLNDIFGAAPVATPVSAPAPVTQAPAPQASPLDLLGGLLSPTPSAAPVTPTPAPVASTGMGMGMMGSPVLGATPVMGAPAPVMGSAPAALNGPQPSMTVYNKNGLTIVFDPIKQASHPNITVVNITFANSSPTPFSNFEFKAAVPKYLKLQVNPPTGNVVALGQNVTQQLKLMNTLHGEKPLALKIKLDFVVNGAPVGDIFDVNFPANM